ncbi:MAG: LysR family transcriptional regulator [Chloroflexi bacterium]|nr:LysR family transcriptional regulator [Chloroflexota bacterium]OJV92280.1 MAG: hypothetical protein BGO39_30510 [Chloroflexi bacterium 54-19]
MELRHIRYFVAIAEEGSFIRAAERLQIAQPPLSQQIQNMENELQFQLFDRSKRQVQLTRAGSLFLEKCYRILNQMDLAIEDARRISRGEIGRLVVGYINTTFYSTPREMLRVFRLRYPEVELVLRELLTAEQLADLHNSQIDVGFAIMPIQDEALSSEVAFEDKFIVALPENHPLAGQPFVRLEDLANEAFIMHPHKVKSIFYDQIIRLCQQAGFTPKISQEVIQIHTSVNMVAAGMGVALVPGCASSIRVSGVVFKTLYPDPPSLTLGVVWRKNDPSPVLQAFLDVVREIRELADAVDSLAELRDRIAPLEIA